MTNLTISQRTALALIPKFTSVFSFLGSTWIIIEVLTEKTKRTVPYHRLLLAMSFYDVMESTSSFLSTWPIPDGTPDVLWASGNESTCSAQGFVLQLTLAVPFYNAMLSIYYVLVINYNYTDRRLRSFVEPCMHIFCFLWPFTTGMIAGFSEFFNNADLWCWIAPLPRDCIGSWSWEGDPADNPNPCVRGDNVWAYQFGFYFIPLWISIAVGTFSTYMVYHYVYVQDEKTLRYRRPQRKVSAWNVLKSFRQSKRSGLVGGSSERKMLGGKRPNKVEEGHPSTTTTTTTTAANENVETPNENAAEPRGSASSKARPSDRTSGLASVPEDKDDMNSKDFEVNDRSSIEKPPRPGLIDNTPHNLSTSMRQFSSGHDPTGAWSISMRTSSKSSVSTVDSADVSAIQDELARRAIKAEEESSRRQAEREASENNEEEGGGDEPVVDYPRPGLRQRYEEWKEKREQYARDMPHTVEVFQQALFYLGTFYCTHMWSTTNRAIQAVTGESSFFIMVMHSFFDPFQGFLNFWVYQRPRYIQTKKKHPTMNFFQICRVIFRFTYMGEYVPPNKTNTGTTTRTG